MSFTSQKPIAEMSRDEVLMAWQNAEAILKAAKEAEMELRKYVFSMAFPGHEKGTARVPLGNGYHLKCVGKLNYTLDNALVQDPTEPENIDAKVSATEIALDKIRAMGNEGAFIADRLVKWKPEISVKEYDGLAAPYKAIINEVLTIKPGAPTLEIEEPKKK